MKPKFVALLGLFALCAICVAIFCIYRQKSVVSLSKDPNNVAYSLASSPLPHQTNAQPDASNFYRSVTRVELDKHPRNRLTLKELEALGHLPSAPSTEELKLAEKTSWWGKPLAPEAFWRDRPVWYDPTDHSASDRGRQCPPVPFDDPSLRQCSTQDLQLSGSATPEGYTPRYVSNDYEQNFWTKWARLFPHSSRMIDDEQMRTARSIMSSELRSRQPKQRGRPVTAEDIAQRWEKVGQSAVSDGYSPEAFERRAIYTIFVLNQYGKQETTRPASIEQWRGIVPDEYLNASKEQLLEMHKEWQRAYVKRLGKELPKHPQLAPFADRYIKAYKEAWGL